MRARLILASSPTRMTCTPSLASFSKASAASSSATGAWSPPIVSNAMRRNYSVSFIVRLVRFAGLAPGRLAALASRVACPSGTGRLRSLALLDLDDLALVVGAALHADAVRGLGLAAL